LAELVEESFAGARKLSLRKEATIAPGHVCVSTCAVLRIHYNFVGWLAWRPMEEFGWALASPESTYLSWLIWLIHDIKATIVHGNICISSCSISFVLPLIREHRLLWVRHVAIMRTEEIAVVRSTFTSGFIPEWH
jgi:hypothetical protein